MKFKYIATSKGKKEKIKNIIEANTKEAAIRELRSRNLTVITIKAQKSFPFKDKILSSLGLVRQLDKVMMTKHLAIMIKAGLTVNEALSILKDQTSSYKLKNVLNGVLRRVEGGDRVSNGLALYPKVFSPFYINMVKVGEEGGTLEDNLRRLAVQSSKDFELRRRVKSAMLYPLIILIVTVGLGMAISIFVLPKLSSLFASMKFELPFLTRMLIKGSNFLKNYGLWVVLGMIAFVFFAIWLARLKAFKPFFHKIYLEFPILKRVVRNLNLARFSYILGTLLHSGISITEALDVTSKVLGNYYYKNALKTSITDVESGLHLSAGLEKYPKLFPPVVYRMINVGENTGNLEEVLSYLGEFYEAEVDTLTKNLATILEPILLVIIGLIAGGLAVAIISPIYNFLGALG